MATTYKVLDPAALRHYREQMGLGVDEWAAKRHKTRQHQYRIELGWEDGKATRDQKNGRRAEFEEILALVVQQEAPELFRKAEALYERHLIDLVVGDDGIVSYPNKKPGDTAPKSRPRPTKPKVQRSSRPPTRKRVAAKAE